MNNADFIAIALHREYLGAHMNYHVLSCKVCESRQLQLRPTEATSGLTRTVEYRCRSCRDVQSVTVEATPEKVMAYSHLSGLRDIEAKSDFNSPYDLSHVKWMLEQICFIQTDRPKANRWLGFAQCALGHEGRINLQDTADVMRELVLIGETK